jgi:hypothetical protein
MKIEAGKTYKLIDKDGYFKSDSGNIDFFRHCFSCDCVKIDHVNGPFAYDADHILVVSFDEIQFFEEVK